MKFLFLVLSFVQYSLERINGGISGVLTEPDVQRPGARLGLAASFLLRVPAFPFDPDLDQPFVVSPRILASPGERFRRNFRNENLVAFVISSEICLVRWFPEASGGDGIVWFPVSTLVPVSQYVDDVSKCHLVRPVDLVAPGSSYDVHDLTDVGLGSSKGRRPRGSSGTRQRVRGGCAAGEKSSFRRSTIVLVRERRNGEYFG